MKNSCNGRQQERRDKKTLLCIYANGWMLCYALPEQAAQQSYNFIEDYGNKLYDRIY